MEIAIKCVVYSTEKSIPWIFNDMINPQMSISLLDLVFCTDVFDMGFLTITDLTPMFQPGLFQALAFISLLPSVETL